MKLLLKEHVRVSSQVNAITSLAVAKSTMEPLLNTTKQPLTHLIMMFYYT